MTEQERINKDVLQQLAVQDAKFAMFMEESKQQREDMRRAQEKHDADMREVNKKIDDKFDKLSSQIHNLTIAAVVGFGAIVAAVGGLVFAAFK